MHQQDSDGVHQSPPIPYHDPQNFDPPRVFLPAAPPKRTGWRRFLGWGCASIFSLVVVIIIAAAVSNKNNTPPAAAGAGTQPVTNASDPLAVGAPALPPSSAPAAPIAQQVTYACTGHAPDGIDITFGPDGSNNSATTLPFTHTTGLITGAQYYVTTAQLQGGGSVSCTTTLTYGDADGTAQTVTKNATADGGYNIASAQICSTFSGGWNPC